MFDSATTINSDDEDYFHDYDTPKNFKEKRGKGWEDHISNLRSKYLFWCIELMLIGVCLKFVAAILNEDTIIISIIKCTIDIISTILYTLSISVFITVFVSNTIEKYERRKWVSRVDELRKSIARSAFESLYKMIMPKQIFDKISADIIKCKIVRKNMSWEYRFEILDNNNLVCECKSTYQLENIGSDIADNPVSISFSNDDDATSELLYVMAKAGEKTISSYSYLNPDESLGLKISEKENTTTAKIVGKISQGKKDAISISHVIKTEYKNVIQEVFFTKLPIINGSLLVQFPKDYHFHFCPSTASEFKLIEVLPSNGKVTQIYKFEGAVLPNQGFAFSLNRKNKEELKLECLKIISQNFTHKLRNVFGSVISISDALIQSENLDEHSKSMIVDILNSGKRAIEVMKDLESFEEDKKNRFERMNLRVYIQELLMQNDTKNWIKNHIIVKYNYEFNDDILDILSNDDLLKKLFITLFEYIYSKKIDNNSSIVLYLDNIYIDSPLKCYNEVKIGEYVALSIVGNGVKINRQDLNECFEPFSTTTKTNNSTGLEMAKILNTMQLHSGYCDLMSEEKTIQFKLFFPVYRHGVITKVPSVPLHTLMGNRECILVIDDEEKERIRVLNILNSLDYRPSVIDSGVDAIELLKQNRNKFDLVILDMVMPDGLNGSDTYEKITEINPNQKAIIVSGYPEKDIINEIEKARKLGAGRYIRKPYTLQDLGEAIKYELMEPHV